MSRCWGSEGHYIWLEGEVRIRSRSLISAFEVVEAAAGGSYHTRVALSIG
jgi:hypothetical protein